MAKKKNNPLLESVVIPIAIEIGSRILDKLTNPNFSYSRKRRAEQKALLKKAPSAAVSPAVEDKKEG
jgi:hypothetical protein